MLKNNSRPSKIGLMGPFGFGNLGDAAIQQAMLQNIRLYLAGAEIIGFSLNPEDTEKRHGIQSFPIGRMAKLGWLHPDSRQNPKHLVNIVKLRSRTNNSKNRLVRLAGRIFLGPPLELLFILNASRIIKKLDCFIVSGGGQLDDYWGGPLYHPYTLLVWSVLAKLHKVKLHFVSVGAGPINARLSRWFIKTALALSDYCSYRDQDSKQLIEKIGFHRPNPVFPDLAHSLATTAYFKPQSTPPEPASLIVGVSPMAYFDPRVWPESDQQVFLEYLTKLTLFVKWLVENHYTVLLFASETTSDKKVVMQMRDLLVKYGISKTDDRVVAPTIETVDELLQHLATTDMVIASRFHGVLLSQLLNKPVLALSYHQKINVLMADMRQADYCLPINQFDLAQLKEKFSALQTNCAEIKPIMAARTQEYREELDKQYQRLFGLDRK